MGIVISLCAGNYFVSSEQLNVSVGEENWMEIGKISDEIEQGIQFPEKEFSKKAMRKYAQSLRPVDRKQVGNVQGNLLLSKAVAQQCSLPGDTVGEKRRGEDDVLTLNNEGNKVDRKKLKSIKSILVEKDQALGLVDKDSPSRSKVVAQTTCLPGHVVEDHQPKDDGSTSTNKKNHVHRKKLDKIQQACEGAGVPSGSIEVVQQHVMPGHVADEYRQRKDEELNSKNDEGQIKVASKQITSSGFSVVAQGRTTSKSVVNGNQDVKAGPGLNSGKEKNRDEIVHKNEEEKKVERNHDANRGKLKKAKSKKRILGKSRLKQVCYEVKCSMKMNKFSLTDSLANSFARVLHNLWRTHARK